MRLSPHFNMVGVMRLEQVDVKAEQCEWHGNPILETRPNQAGGEALWFFKTN